MARGGRLSIDVDYSEFTRRLAIAAHHVETGTKKATKAACEEILQDSLQEVPKGTGTLADSAYYRIDGSYHNFTAEIGYGGNGDPINPDTGKAASEYMVTVHEDLEMVHPHGGKAKYLEDPMKRYQAKFLPGAAAQIAAALK